MLLNQKIVVVMPAYNAAKTVEKTFREIPLQYVDQVILVDDASQDNTIQIAEQLGISSYRLPHNKGYGGNQKKCYELALEKGADIVIMLHPDYQYDPKLILAMGAMIGSGVYDVVIGSRILSSHPMDGGMPLYKYISNRFLTLVQNWMLGAKLSEYHTGYRAFHRRVLEKLPLKNNSDDFVFDNQMLAQAIFFKFKIGEISCPAKYFKEASSIRFWRAIFYGFGVLWTSVQFLLAKLQIYRARIFSD